MATATKADPRGKIVIVLCMLIHGRCPANVADSGTLRAANLQETARQIGESIALAIAEAVVSSLIKKG